MKRLQRGLYQRMLIEYVWGCTVPRVSGVALPEWSPDFSYVDVAEECGCSPEQLRDDARDAHARGLVILDEKRGRGLFRMKITHERWGNLKDYVAPKPQVMPEKPAKPVRWLSRGASVEPGQTVDLPKFDFPVERIS